MNHLSRNFDQADIGTVVLLATVPWYVLLWHWIKTRLFRRNEDHPGTFVVVDIRDTILEIEPAYRCSGCRNYVAWSNGAMDDEPFMCDDCWFEKREKSNATV